MKREILIRLSFVVIAFFAFNTIQAQCSKHSQEPNGSHASHNQSAVSQETGQNEATFKVYGKCEMCQKRIQDAALTVPGVKTANWDIETKMLKVSFDGKVDIHKVHAAIAGVGHDTEMHKATDEAYAALPGCCKYERASDSHSGNDGHNH
jgi:copper chaperone CopZ